MSFGGRQLMLAGLIELHLSSGIVRLSEGGFVKLDGHTYRAKDKKWGALGRPDEIEESVGDQAPGMEIEFLPVSAAAAAALAAPANHLAPVRLKLVRVDRATGIADPASVEIIGDLLLDEANGTLSRSGRVLRLGLVSAADRLMTVNKGNTLSSRHHESVWPGELGLRNAVDTAVTVAWRVKAPPRGTVGSRAVAGSGGGGGSGGGAYGSESVGQPNGPWIPGWLD